jgi:hypothetical protein
MRTGTETAGNLGITKRDPAGASAGGIAVRRQAGLSGIAAIALFGTGSALWGLDMPDAGAPVTEIVDFYRDTSGRIVTGATLSVLAIAAFLVFAAAVRQILIEAGGADFLATTAFGGALLGVAAGLGAETINMVGALRADDGELNNALAQSLFEISQILGSTAAGLGIGVFAIATAEVALRTRAVLPRPHAIVTLLVGIALLTPLSRINVVSGSALLLLTAIISVALLRRPPEELPASHPAVR